MTDSAELQRVAREVGIAAKVAHLRRPDAYPDPTTAVAVTETHMSWVFLADGYAYKLKKPVRTEFLDFSTVAARRLDCQREVALNRRLAADVYIGTVALTLDRRGRLRLGGSGRIVDWLVRMRRLPAARTLEAAIASGTVEQADIRRLARRLVGFFREAPPAPMGAAEYVERLGREVRFYGAQLGRPAYGLPAEAVNGLARAQWDFLAMRSGMVGARGGHVVDGHGDLRPEHVYLDDEPVVLDCIEFNRDLRLLDPVNELSYLAMECHRLGAPHVGAWLFEAYRGPMGDDPPAALIAFYQCLCAFLRATIAVWHLDDPRLGDTAKWSARARDYLRLAQGYAERLA